METQTDHDHIITLLSEVKGIRNDIKDIKDGVKDSITDHESRIRILEKKQWLWSGAAGIVSAGIALIAQYLIQHK